MAGPLVNAVQDRLAVRILPAAVKVNYHPFVAGHFQILLQIAAGQMHQGVEPVYPPGQQPQQFKPDIMALPMDKLMAQNIIKLLALIRLGQINAGPPESYYHGRGRPGADI